MRSGTMLGFAVGLAFAHAGVLALAATPPGSIERVVPNPTIQGTPEPASAREPRPQDRRVSGNPLWAIPLRALSATRDRPIFSPSRRPPAPPAVAAAPAAPPKAPVAAPAEPDKPPLTLVGTIVGDSEGFGIFLDQATKAVIRLKTGQDHVGWVLQSVHGREATFKKGRQSATLALPAPGSDQTNTSAADQTPLGAPPGNLWMDGDGQLIAPPPRAMSRR